MGAVAKYSEFSDIVTTFSTIRSLFDKMEADGLVILTKVTKPYKTNYAELTDLGYKVAQKLAAASDIMDGLTPESETDCSAPAKQGSVVKR
jgi:hypothetical protein